MAGNLQEFPRMAKYKKVDILNLRFDPDNPRLGGVGKGKLQDQIQSYLEGPPHFALDLVGSFVENGFLPYEPLIVRQRGKLFYVIEGNRRLAAVRAIFSDEKRDAAVRAGFQRIPVLVFSRAASLAQKDDVSRYLGVKHLFGYRDWPPTSKAMFLDLRIRSKKDLEHVLRELNITKQEVARYLIPYRLRKAAKRVFGTVDAEDFWSLAESFGRRKIRLYIQLDVERRTMRIKSFNPMKLRYLAQFLYGKKRRVTDTRQLSALGRILGSPQAAAKLERGASLEEASLYSASKDETVVLLHRQLERVLDRIRTISPGKEESVRFLAVLEDFVSRLRKRIS